MARFLTRAQFAVLCWITVAMLQTEHASAQALKLQNQGQDLVVTMDQPHFSLKPLRSLQVKALASEALAKLQAQADEQQSELVQLNVKQLAHTYEAGAPELPFYALWLKGKPEDFELEANEARDDDKTILPNLILAPAMDWPCRCKAQAPRWAYKPEAYAKSTALYRLDYWGDFRGVPLTRLMVFPFGHRAEGGIEVRKQLALNIRWKQSARTEAVQAYQWSQLQPLAQQLAEEATGMLGQERYMIFTPKKFVPALQSFVAWKEAQGLVVDVHTLEQLGSSTTTITSALHKLYRETPYQYALIVGHEKLFPTNYVETIFSQDTPSDWPYFIMGGEGDQIPDVYYGRMAVENEAQIRQQIEKWQRYALHAQTQVAANFMIGIASDEGSNPTDVEYMEQMMAPLVKRFGWQAKRFYQGEREATAHNLLLSLGRDPLWLNYIGHGSGNSWPSITGKAFDVRDLVALEQQGPGPIVIDVACQNGRFSTDDRMGERLLNETNTQGQAVGATAYYGGSVDISWHPPAIMAVGVNRYLSEVPHSSSLGAILWAGHFYLAQHYDGVQDQLENWQWYHLQGDPAMLLPSENGQ